VVFLLSYQKTQKYAKVLCKKDMAKGNKNCYNKTNRAERLFFLIALFFKKNNEVIYETGFTL